MNRSETWLLAARAANSYAREAERLAAVWAGLDDVAVGSRVLVPNGTNAATSKARALASLVVDLTVDAA